MLFTALDHRAATLEKLGEHRSALKDAKAMIDLKPRNAKVLPSLQF
jgi:F-box/TPR repeat protein Pof3